MISKQKRNFLYIARNGVKTMYQNYIFDLYGTLVDIHTNEQKSYLWEKMAEFYGFYGVRYTPVELKKAFRMYCKQEEEKIKGVTYPEIQIEYVFQKMFTEKGVNAALDLAIHAGQMFRIVSTKYIKLYEGVEEFLIALKQAGKKIYLLSNAQRIFTQFEMDFLDITKYFDGIVFSSEEGCAKPDGIFYECILKRYQLDKKESIMIGNDPITDIKGAYDVGLASFYIHSNISPKQEQKLYSNYQIMDGDFTKIKDLILAK